jgi:hypothetical protein
MLEGVTERMEEWCESPAPGAFPSQTVFFEVLLDGRPGQGVWADGAISTLITVRRRYGAGVRKVLVDLVRFELTTSSMPWKRAPNCATGPIRPI